MIIIKQGEMPVNEQMLKNRQNKSEETLFPWLVRQNPAIRVVLCLRQKF
jgi:hypothetical protein